MTTCFQKYIQLASKINSEYITRNLLMIHRKCKIQCCIPPLQPCNKTIFLLWLPCKLTEYQHQERDLSPSSKSLAGYQPYQQASEIRSTSPFEGNSLVIFSIPACTTVQKKEQICCSQMPHRISNILEHLRLSQQFCIVFALCS